MPIFGVFARLPQGVPYAPKLSGLFQIFFINTVIFWVGWCGARQPGVSKDLFSQADPAGRRDCVCAGGLRLHLLLLFALMAFNSFLPP